MYREDIEDDLNDHYSKITLETLVRYLGYEEFSKESKSGLISMIIDGFNSNRFNLLKEKLSPQCADAVKYIVWEGITTFQIIDSKFHSNLSLGDFCLNTDDPFLCKFKSRFTKEIQFSKGLRYLFKQKLYIKEPVIHVDDESITGIIFKSSDSVFANLDGIADFIRVKKIRERGIEKRVLVRDINEFKKLFNYQSSISENDIGVRFLIKFLSGTDGKNYSIEELQRDIDLYKKGILFEDLNFDRYIYYPFVKFGKAESTVNIFLKRGRYSIISRIKDLDGWCSIEGIVRELSLKEETEIFDSSYFGALMSVNVQDKFKREFSNNIDLTFKKDNEDFLISPMCRGIIFLLHTLGGADIVLDSERTGYGLTPLEYITHFKLNSRGKYLLGGKKEFSTDSEEFNYTFHNQRLLITTRGKNSKIINFLKRIGDSRGEGAFLISYSSFIKSCNNHDDYNFNRDRLIELAGENPHPIWLDFIDGLDDRLNPIYNEQELVVVNFPRDDELFLELITEEKKLRDLYYMVEGIRGAFTRKNYKLFKNLMKNYGYIL